MSAQRPIRQQLPTAWISVVAGVRILAWLTLGAPTSAGYSQTAFLALVLSFSLASGLLAWGSRNRDSRASSLATIYLLVATTYTDWGAAAAIRSPDWLLVPMRVIQPAAFLPFYVWTFCSHFPRAPQFPQQVRRLERVQVATYALGLLLVLLNLVPIDTLPALLADLMDWVRADSPERGFWTVVGLTTLPALVVAGLRTRRSPADERRRVALMLFGIVVGGVPPLVIATLVGVIPAFRDLRSDPVAALWMSFIEYGGLLLQLAITTFAILARQALDVRFIVRRTLQYALARKVILAVNIIPFAVLLWIGYQNRSRPVVELFAGAEFTLVATVTLFAIALTRARLVLGNTIDRMFFREQYDTRRTLTQLVDRSRLVEDGVGLARLCAAEIDRALHVERISMLYTDGSESVLRSATGDVRPLMTASGLVQRMAGRSTPIDVRWEPPTPIVQGLSGDEQGWLADSGFRLLVPLLDSGGHVLGVLGLGEKKSELPFSQEDRELLVAIAGSVALALENQSLRQDSVPSSGDRARSIDPSRPADATPFVEPTGCVCSRCGRVQKSSSADCRHCHGPLEEGEYPLVLVGKYELGNRVGRGGMGIVFRARDAALGRDVAIKTLPRVSARRSERLRREARAMAAVSHPNLAVILAIEMWRGTPFLVFEYLPGGTVADRLRTGPLGTHETLSLGRTLARVAERVHAAGILHRDIKPSNIGYASDGTAKLLDFGLARLIAVSGTDASLSRPRGAAMTADGADAGSGTASVSDVGPPDASRNGIVGDSFFDLTRHDVVGTVLYLSPEAIGGEPPDPGFDLWSINVVLYECIAGRNPFAAQNHYAVLARIASGTLPDIRTFDPDVPEAVAGYFENALSPDRNQRPKSAKELHARLVDLETHHIGISF